MKTNITLYVLFFPSILIIQRSNNETQFIQSTARVMTQSRRTFYFRTALRTPIAVHMIDNRVQLVFSTGLSR